MDVSMTTPSDRRRTRNCTQRSSSESSWKNANPDL